MILKGVFWLLLVAVVSAGVHKDHDWSWGTESTLTAGSSTEDSVSEVPLATRTEPIASPEESNGREGRAVLSLGKRLCTLLGVHCKTTSRSPAPLSPDTYDGPPANTPAAATSSYATLPYEDALTNRDTHGSTARKGYHTGLKPIFDLPKPFIGPSTLSPSYDATKYTPYPPILHPTYAAPTSTYGPPLPTYVAPTSTYGPPVPTYAAPKPTYVAPTSTYGPPVPTYAAPKLTYVAPTSTYGPPIPTYAAPKQPYAAPTSTYVASKSTNFVPSYAAPKPTYSVPQASYTLSQTQVRPTTVVHHQHIHTHIHQGTGPNPATTQVVVSGTTAVPPSITTPVTIGTSLTLPGPFVEAETPYYREDCRCVHPSLCATYDIVGVVAPPAFLEPRSRTSDILSNATDVEDDLTTTAVPKGEATTQSPARPGKSLTVTNSSEDSRVRRDTLGVPHLHLSVADNTTHLQQRHDGGYAPGVGGCGPDHVCCRSPVNAQPRRQTTCGRRHATGLLGRVKNPSYHTGDTEFGEYPWQAAILKRKKGDTVYVCGAALLDDRHVVTAAHCVHSLQASQLKVRLGEWDVASQREFYNYVELPVAALHIHPHYYAGNLHNDIALITLQTSVDFTANPHISPVCLPDSYSSFLGQRCHSTGWGKDAFGDHGQHQSLLQEVEVPVVSHHQCQEALRHTHLGHNFTLHQGMLCAGGEEGRDTCKGDGGGPLVCSDPEGRFQLAGLVSWGVGCGLAGVPGVYVNVAHYLEWLRQLGVVSHH
ncbi:uncharacterized protein [Panulirus ornatus]|uniref:uncharacterized protein n=1 Tax=Panulirus ornatus TaxID=150431 RepID=UPI003A889B81